MRTIRAFSPCPWAAALIVAGWLSGPRIAEAAPCDTSGVDLVVDGITCQLSGVHSFTNVSVVNGGVIEVNPHDGNMADKVSTGNLELRASSILVDATSTITARGRGYQTPKCGNGVGPTANAGGIGGCAVRDSGGGGAHFGNGGRGTKDCGGGGCNFPADWEEDCGNTLNGAGNACNGTSNCRNNDGLPPTNGNAYWHSIYEPEFGASGGDKGCRDGDGFGASNPNTSGPGGGRIVLVGLDGMGTGSVTVDGTIDTTGQRGCGNGNDSAGGGAGGTVFIVGDQVDIGDNAFVSAAGGLGGDTQGTIDPTGECGYAQQGSTCDDCGGGGGGGIVSVLSVTSSISDTAVFDVSGALGGTCPICQGEAGGGVGELQIAGGFVGEFCDGYDNDFDDQVDEGQPVLDCGSSMIPSCVGGLPQECPPDVPTCIGPVTDTRARFTVILDTSASMLTDLTGTPTYGDGSVGHLGLDVNGDGVAGNDSRLFLAKEALTTVISAYPEIDFALARYHQDQSLDRSCQLAHWFECNNICCTYDDPTNNMAPDPNPPCTVDAGAAGMLPVSMNSPGDECINYAGNCGPPERGADVVVGFGADINQYLMWLDHDESNFVNDTTIGDYCDFENGGDCELRGTGPTPLAGSLQTVSDYLEPIAACDAALSGGCRTYGVILLTDGEESCQGDPVTAAADLLANQGIETFVIGFSVLPGEEAQLNAIANAGSLSGTRNAFLVGDENALANALASIVSNSIVFETCNSVDDDCDGNTDEGFVVGVACDDGDSGVCLGTGVTECNATGDGTTCNITDPGAMPGVEGCDGIDNDCDASVDEGLDCIPDCTPTGPEVCDGVDNDCNGAIDEDDPALGETCGATDMGLCELGINVCIAGTLVCIGETAPQVEVCNGLDDDCDGVADNMAPCPADTACVDGGCRIECAGGEFSCPPGFDCVDAAGDQYCVPGPCINCTPEQACINDMCVDLCENVNCEANEECRDGVCYDCHVLGCPDGQLCNASQCVDDPCANVDCQGAPGCEGGCSCVGGACVPDCNDEDCPDGESCAADGSCQADPCGVGDCAIDEVCVDGECQIDRCDEISCEPGDVCAGNECVDDACVVVECSDGRTCQVEPGGVAVCADLRERQYITAAGNGCQATGSDSSGLLFMLSLLGALALVGRRRRSVS